MKKRALVAMSGGVDSSVCAYLAMQKGYECTGATMLLCDGQKSMSDIDDARAVCEKLKIEHLVFDMRKEFEEYVVDSFVSSYEKGATPNPCVLCNRFLKLGLLYKKAKSLGFDTIVTGHYARVENGFIKKAKDIKKDQTYVLCLVDSCVAQNLYLPLGDYTKEEVRKIALENGFVSARKSDSQDICFVEDGDYAAFIEKKTGKSYSAGSFVDKNGNVLGSHEGIIRYTVGQRKGLGIAFGEPMYVKSKNVCKNEVVLCANDELFESTLTAGELNFFVPRDFSEMRIKAKIRYNQTEKDALLQLDGDCAKVVFDEPQRAIAFGQYVAFYKDDILIGGGVIECPDN